MCSEWAVKAAFWPHADVSEYYRWYSVMAPWGRMKCARVDRRKACLRNLYTLSSHCQWSSPPTLTFSTAYPQGCNPHSVLNMIDYARKKVNINNFKSLADQQTNS